MLKFKLNVEQLCFHPSINDANQYENSKLVILPSNIFKIATSRNKCA